MQLIKQSTQQKNGFHLSVPKQNKSIYIKKYPLLITRKNKSSILLEEHLANKNKRCRDCITKHFLHIIGLAEEAQMLAKQAYDEANHFRMVKEVVEHISGVEADLAELAKTHGKKMPSQGVFILDKYNAQGDELVLALYQYLAEGRASVVWQAMAESIEDEYVSKRYAKIARDERFHSEIGRLKLEKLCTTPEAQQRALDMTQNFVWDLYENTCLSIAQVSEEGQVAMKQAYGQPTRELSVAI